MISKETTACFTGYRPGKFEFSLMKGFAYKSLCRSIYEEIDEAVLKGYTAFMYGGALGFDIVAAEQVLQYKLEKKADIALICAIPFFGQQEKWSKIWQERYANLLKRVDKIHVVANGYHKGCYHMRNKFMVDSSSLVIAYYDGKSGGSRQTCVYAAKKGVRVVNIAMKREELSF